MLLLDPSSHPPGVRRLPACWFASCMVFGGGVPLSAGGASLFVVAFRQQVSGRLSSRLGRPTIRQLISGETAPISELFERTENDGPRGARTAVPRYKYRGAHMLLLCSFSDWEIVTRG